MIGILLLIGFFAVLGLVHFIGWFIDRREMVADKFERQLRTYPDRSNVTIIKIDGDFDGRIIPMRRLRPTDKSITVRPVRKFRFYDWEKEEA